MVKQRNDLLHGTYMIGVDKNGAPIDLLVEKQTPDKFGPRTVAVVSSEIEMASIIKKCTGIDAAIQDVFSAVWKHIRAKPGARGLIGVRLIIRSRRTSLATPTTWQNSLPCCRLRYEI